MVETIKPVRLTTREKIERRIQEVCDEGFGSVEIHIRNGYIYRIVVKKEEPIDNHIAHLDTLK